jgi:hypothetical protein
MAISCLKSIMPFILRLENKCINFIGGEPTQHAYFIDILSPFLRNCIKVGIFTNGKLTSRLTTILQNIDGEFDFCVNRSNPVLTQDIISLYQKLGYRIYLAMTVFKLGQVKSHIFDEIRTYRLGHNYRLGIAFPIWPDKQNAYLPPEDYPVAADEIFEFVRQGLGFGLRPSFDCGFPYCFFKDTQKQFFKENDIGFNSNCGPIPDIGPDLSAIPCLPLARFKIPLSENAEWDDINHQLNMKLAACTWKPIFDKCNTCEYLLSGKCSGGCAALRIVASGTNPTHV